MIGNYSITEWLAFFYIYSFFGWCIESTIVSVTRHHLINRGFMAGPMLPLYGSGALVILLATIWVNDNVLYVYIFGATGATLLELVTGIVMEQLFKIRYWDYSSKRFNFKGYICLKSSLFWGVLSVLVVCVVHRPVAHIITELQPQTLNIIVGIITVVALIDFAHAFKNAYDFKKLLSYETRIKKELSLLTEKFQMAGRALAEQRHKDGKHEHAADFVMAGASEDEIDKQKMRIEHLKEELEEAKQKLLSFRFYMFKGFPSATSKKFGEALEEFKKKFNK